MTYLWSCRLFLYISIFSLTLFLFLRAPCLSVCPCPPVFFTHTLFHIGGISLLPLSFMTMLMMTMAVPTP